MNHRADSLKKNLVEILMQPLKKQTGLSFESHSHNLYANSAATCLEPLFPWPSQARLALGVLIGRMSTSGACTMNKTSPASQATSQSDTRRRS
jgi:hypothetical protein